MGVSSNITLSVEVIMILYTWRFKHHCTYWKEVVPEYGILHKGDSFAPDNIPKIKATE